MKWNREKKSAWIGYFETNDSKKSDLVKWYGVKFKK